MESTRRPAGDVRTFRLKVTLRGSRPPIWRRLEVDAGVTLAELHDVLQIVMGWTDSHLHQFRRGTKYYGEPDPNLGMDREDERRVQLRQVLRRPKDRMVYEYDFGDGWEHDVLLEASGESTDEQTPPRVLAGKRACPPEDVGGIGGYYNLLEAIRNPTHPDHLDMVEWAGTVDPDAFEIDEVNAYFQERPAFAEAAAGKPRGRATTGKPRGRATAGKPRGRATAGKPRGRATAGKPRGRTTAGKPRGRTTTGKPRVPLVRR